MSEEIPTVLWRLVVNGAVGAWNVGDPPEHPVMGRVETVSLFQRFREALMSEESLEAAAKAQFDFLNEGLSAGMDWEDYPHREAAKEGMRPYLEAAADSIDPEKDK